MAEAPGRLARSPAVAPRPEVSPAPEDGLDLHAALEIIEDHVRTRPILSVVVAGAAGFLVGRLLRS